MTYRELYESGRSVLTAAAIEEADTDARLLLECVCERNRSFLLVHGDSLVEQERAECYLGYIAERAKRIPLQQITGVQEFMGLTFQVNRHVLIPRQDTEILVEEVLRNLHGKMCILDMCTGSGCILLSILHYARECVGVGVDISKEALCVARENAKRILRKDGKDSEEISCVQACFIESDLFEKVTGKYQIIVSNPPYIRSDVIPTLMPEVKDYEPIQALDGHADGLFYYKKIIDQCSDYLSEDGRLYFEIGFDQGAEVSELMKQAGFSEITVVKDYAGQDRVVHGKRS